MAWATLVALVLVVLFNGYEVFFPGEWSVSTFLIQYIDIAIFIGKYVHVSPLVSSLIECLIVLWLCSWVVFQKRPFKLSEVNLSEMEKIEAEKQQYLEEPELRAWWRRYII